MQNEKNLTYKIEFLGCKVNSYEVECVANELENNGYRIFDINKDISPNIIVVNTCAVTQTSVSKCRKIISSLKRKFPQSLMVVMGCYSHFGAKEIAGKLKADIIIGTQNRDKIIELVNEFNENHKQILIEDKNVSLKYENLKLDHFTYHTRAYIKIQDGCNNFCSYCLIPFLRGRSRSRAKEDIILEISNLIQNGYKEIVLTGIDMSSYGLDLYQNYTFSNLLEDILINCPNLYRLRISSIEESRIDDKFLELLAKYPQIANHLHIPLQSGSKKIIELMNRKYNLDEFRDKVQKIRKIRPDVAISTDIIVGFPCETDDDFLETFNFAKNINFSKIHVFPYSIRQGTVAAKMDNQVDPITKKRRCLQLISLSDQLSFEYECEFNGRKMDFLIESEENGVYTGHSTNFLEIKVRSNKNLKGEIINQEFFTSLHC